MDKVGDIYGRIRRRLIFELDVNKPELRDLYDWLIALRAKRQYVTTIRNSLLLFRDLMRGNTDVLLDLFPGIVMQIQHAAQSPANAEFAQLLADAIAQRMPQPVYADAAPRSQNATLQAETSQLPGIFVDGGAGGSVSGNEARTEFAAGFGSLFSDDTDEDDLWD